MCTTPGAAFFVQRDALRRARLFLTPGARNLIYPLCGGNVRESKLASAAISKGDQRRQERIDDLKLLFGFGKPRPRKRSSDEK